MCTANFMQATFGPTGMENETARVPTPSAMKESREQGTMDFT